MYDPVVSPRPLVAIATFAGLILASASAFAQAHIGGAVVVQNDVRGQTQGKTQSIGRGDRVYQNELVRTGAESLAKLMLLDETNVAIGPTSQLTLDRFVYDPDAGAKKVTLSATKGAFRFISGRAPHEAYEVRTPQASIGVRGTTYDVRVEGASTTVVLQEGAVRVCRRGTQTCAELTVPGQSIVVTNRGLEEPLAPTQKTWDFGALCGTGNEICGHTTQFAFNDAKPRAAAPPRRTRIAAPASERPPAVQTRPPRERIVAAEPPRRARIAAPAPERPPTVRTRPVRERVVVTEPPRRQTHRPRNRAPVDEVYDEVEIVTRGPGFVGPVIVDGGRIWRETGFRGRVDRGRVDR